MRSRFERWAEMPAQWSAAAALDDPLASCSLSAWLPLEELTRGAQIGPRDVHRVWCIGLYRYPYQRANSQRSARLGVTSPWLYILPQALGALCRAAGERYSQPCGPVALCRALTRLDLCIPSNARRLVKSINLPGACGEHRIAYAFRGEVAFAPAAQQVHRAELLARLQALRQVQQQRGGVEGPELPAVDLSCGLSAPEWAVTRFLGTMARTYCAGWYASNPPAVLVPRPQFGVQLGPRPARASERRPAAVQQGALF